MRTTVTIVMTLALGAISGCQTSIQQGDVRAVTVSMQRGSYFKRDVRMQIKASDGIDVGPTDILVKASESPEKPVL